MMVIMLTMKCFGDEVLQQIMICGHESTYRGNVERFISYRYVINGLYYANSIYY